MDATLKVECPECHCVLVVDRRSGKVLEVRRPIREASSGDRLEDALRNVRERGTKLDDKMKAVREAEKQKATRLEGLFKEGLDRAKDDDTTSGPRPFDLD